MAPRPRSRRSPAPAAVPLPTARADVAAPWRLRYSPLILSDDIDDVGHAALKLARAACEKKLASEPQQHGAPLHHLLHGLRKLSVSHVRIAYYVEVATHEVWILMIGNRRDIWDEDQGAILERLGSERKQHSAAADRDADAGTSLPEPSPRKGRKRRRG